MAVKEALNETRICNMALGRIGATRINDYTDTSESSTEAIQCRLHYAQTRNALLRSHSWRFARARAELSEDSTAPDFEWDNQFILPTDFFRFRSIYEEDGTTSKSRRHAIEGQRLLTNLSEVSLRYIRKVTNPTKFDPLFVEVLVLRLALKMVPGVAGTETKGLERDIKEELLVLEAKAKAVNMDETDVGGRSDWNLARHGGIGIGSEEERFW